MVRAASKQTLVNAAATHAALAGTRRIGKYLYNAKNISTRKTKPSERPAQYCTRPITSVRSPSVTSAFDARPTYVVTVTLAANRTVDTTVIFTSNTFPAMMPRSLSMSNTLQHRAERSEQPGREPDE